MTLNDQLREKREVTQSEARDKTAKIISGLVPGGSSVYELFTALVQPLHIKRREEWVQNITLRLYNLEQDGIIDLEELSQNEEFNTIITKASLLAQQNHQKEKIEALRNVVINTSKEVIDEILNFEETEFFLTILGRINPTHIFLLKLFNSPNDVAKDRKMVLTHNFTMNSKQLMSKIYPELSKKIDLLAQYWKDLNQFGLLEGNDMSIGRHTKRELQKLTTNLGERFINYISTN